MMVRHSLRSVFYFHHVLGILRVGSHPCSCHIKCSRFFKLTLMLVVTASEVMSTLPELKSLRGAVSTPEFLIFNDKVKGCEFLGLRDGMGGGRLFTEHHGGSGKPPEQNLMYTQRGPSAALWNLPGFYNGLYLPRSQRSCHRTSPSFASPIEEFLLTGVCVCFSVFLFLKCLQDCWLLNCSK